MNNFERDMEREIIDREVVESVADGIEARMAGAGGPEWQEACDRNAAFVDGLFVRYVPEGSEVGREAARLVGAVGLASMELAYGRDETSPRLYGGSAENGVLATYHNAAHPRQVIANMFDYAAKANERRPGTYDDMAFERFVGIGAFHDFVMGNGRGNDERQSALVAVEVLNRLGVTLLDDDETYEGILATTWDPQTGAQAVDPRRPHLEYQRAAAVGDLLTLFGRRGPYLGIGVIMEDLCKDTHDRILPIEAAAAGMPLEGASLDDVVGLVDRSPALQAAFDGMMAGQAGFFEGFRPADPDLDMMYPGRAENVAFLRDLNARYVAGDMSAAMVLAASRDFMSAT